MLLRIEGVIGAGCPVREPPQYPCHKLDKLPNYCETCNTPSSYLEGKARSP